MTESTSRGRFLLSMNGWMNLRIKQILIFFRATYIRQYECMGWVARVCDYLVFTSEQTRPFCLPLEALPEWPPFIRKKMPGFSLLQTNRYYCSNEFPVATYCISSYLLSSFTRRTPVSNA